MSRRPRARGDGIELAAGLGHASPGLAWRCSGDVGSVSRRCPLASVAVACLHRSPGDLRPTHRPPEPDHPRRHARSAVRGGVRAARRRPRVGAGGLRIPGAVRSRLGAAHGAWPCAAGSTPERSSSAESVASVRRPNDRSRARRNVESEISACERGIAAYSSVCACRLLSILYWKKACSRASPMNWSCAWRSSVS